MIHLQLAKRILRYLKGTKGYGLVYSRRRKSEGLLLYSDASWGDDLCDRKSTSGFIFFYNGCPIQWKSKKQGVVAGSSAEAEYVAMYEAMKEGLWILNVFKEIGLIKENDGMRMLVDSKSAIAIAARDKYSNKVKHFELRFNSIKEWVKNGNFILEHCPTEIMLADLLTKSLAVQRFGLLRELNGIGTLSRRSVEITSISDAKAMVVQIRNNLCDADKNTNVSKNERSIRGVK